tara:strand:+ start:3428 stop:4801 length:1374 start_codon:yes stop_codon:yes gene_type:complete
MTIEKRRNSLNMSSLSINSISKSFTSLSEGLSSLSNQTQQLIKETRKSNELKRIQIRQDSEFFRKRRENARRREREDELEASSITGAQKREGNLIQRSTKGFLGRILDFVGTLIIGWAVANLPNIIAAFQKLFGFISRVVDIFKGFLNGMQTFFTTLGTGVESFVKQLSKFNFEQNLKGIRELFDKITKSLLDLNMDFVQSIFGFVNDENIRKAPEVAQKLGIDELTDEEVSLPLVLDKSAIENAQKEIETRDDGGKIVKGEDYLIALNPETGEPDERTEILTAEEDGFILNNEETQSILAEEDEDTENVEDIELIRGLQEIVDLQNRKKQNQKIKRTFDNQDDDKNDNQLTDLSKLLGRGKEEFSRISEIFKKIENFEIQEKDDNDMITVNRKVIINDESNTTFNKTRRKKKIIVVNNQPNNQGTVQLAGSGKNIKSLPTQLNNNNSYFLQSLALK